MKCSDVDRILPDIVDGVSIEGSQHQDVQSHLRTCPDCSELVSDLKMIATEARHLSDCEDPPARVWVRIAAELRAEGLIREPELAQPVRMPGRQRRWNPFWLAPVAVAIVAAGSYMLIHRPATSELARNAATPDVQRSGSPADDDSAERAQLSLPSSSEDNQFLSEVSLRAPTMRATYADQLQAVNSEIRETKAYLSRYPSDMDARQHLLDVYQQKAMLYQIALDRIQ
jgi:hypothetical protein